MKIRTHCITTIVVLTTLCGPIFAEETAPKKIRFTISPETTVFTEPQLPDGRVDYFTAMNQRLSSGATKENNIMTGIIQVLPGELESSIIWDKINGEPIDESVYQSTNALRKKYWTALGYDNPLPIESLRVLAPKLKSLDEYVLETWLKFYTPEEIIAKLPEEEKPKENVDPLPFLKKMEQVRLRYLMDEEYYETHRVFWTEKDRPLLKEWVETTPDLKKQFIDISRRPKFFNPIFVSKENEANLTFAWLPYITTVREVARFFSSWGNWHFPRGEYDEAFECAYATRRYGRTMRTNPVGLVEELTGNAIEGIAQECFVAYLAALDGKKDSSWILVKKWEFMKIEQEIPLPHVPKSFFGERCMALSSLQEMSVVPAEKFVADFEDYDSDEEKANNKELNRKFIELMNSKAEKLDWDKMFRLINAHYDEIEDCVALPERWRQLRAAERVVNRADAMKKELKTRNPNDDPEQFVVDYLLNHLSPAVHACVGAFTRMECSSRMVELMFSLAAFRADHGKYPEKMEELLPKYLDAIPISSYTEKPLRYLNRESEILITGDDEYILDGSDENLENEIKDMKERNYVFAHPKIPGSPIAIIKKAPTP